MATMKLQYGRVVDRIFAAMQSSIEDFNSQGVTNSLWACCELGLPRDSLAPLVQRYLRCERLRLEEAQQKNPAISTVLQQLGKNGRTDKFEVWADKLFCLLEPLGLASEVHM